MRPLSHLSYYLVSGLVFCCSATLVYNCWDYYATRIQDQIVCVAHWNVQLLSLLWLCEGLGLLVCFAGLWAFSGREHELQAQSLLANYTCVFLKICPAVVKVLQLFNLCQLSTICLDLLVLHECNDANLRAVFMTAVLVQWFVCLVGLAASSEVFLPPYLYEPAAATRSYVEQLKVGLRTAGSEPAQVFIYPLGL